MKAFDVLLPSAILILSLVNFTTAFGVPECSDERDLDILWVNYEDKTRYYQCVELNRYVEMPCGGGTWFDFNSQSCKNPREWKPSFDFKEPHPEPIPEPQPEPEPHPEPLPYPDPETDPIENEDEEEKGPPMPPIVSRKPHYVNVDSEELHNDEDSGLPSTKYDGPPIRTRTNAPPTKKPTTKKSYPTPPTPIATAATEIGKKPEPEKKPQSPINIVTPEVVKTRKPRPIPTRKVPIPEPKPEPKPEPQPEPVENDDDEKNGEKVTVRKRKTKMIPTRARLI